MGGEVAMLLLAYGLCSGLMSVIKLMVYLADFTLNGIAFLFLWPFKLIGFVFGK